MLASVLALAFAAGCSNRNAPSANGPQTGDVTVKSTHGVQAITIKATEQFRFVPSTFRVHPGRVRITLDVVGNTPHDLTFTGRLHKAIPLTSHGRSAPLTFSVHRPGRYPFECTIHVAEDMTGTMVVER